MNKIPRFMKEYATFTIKSIKTCEMMLDKYKEIKIRNVEKALKTYERGLITIDETMKAIMEA